MVPASGPLLELLVSKRIFSKAFAQHYQHLSNEALFTTIQHQQLISESHLHTIISESTGMPTTRLSELVCEPENTPETLKSQHILKAYETHSEIAIAISNPYKNYILNTSKKCTLYLMPFNDIQRALSPSRHINLDTILADAIKDQASDIHFYQQDSLEYTIYMRKNGEMSQYATLTKDISAQLNQYIKLNAKCELGTHMTPQDGSITTSENIQIRVSTLPTIHGEDIVIRLFYQQASCDSFLDLGMSKEAISYCENICRAESGLILVTGPTGSGKTTTLYTMLKHLQCQARGVITTLEDPVEKPLYGIRQSSINPAAGYGFLQGLKAILRQDPNIILIGEIRDAATAECVINAAYTGHLVLSSLHTHDVHSTLLRLKSLGCDDYLLAYVLKGIIAQKLIPNPCTCQNNLNKSGCTECNHTGIASRSLQQELLWINRPITSCYNASDMTTLGKIIKT